MIQKLGAEEAILINEIRWRKSSLKEYQLVDEIPSGCQWDTEPYFGLIVLEPTGQTELSAVFYPQPA